MNVSAQHPDLVPVWRELARRVGRGDEPRRLTLRSLTIDEQTAVADLLGLDRLQGSDITLRIDRLAAAMGVAGLRDLTTIAVSTVGPIVDTVAQRAKLAAGRTSLWADLEADLVELSWVDAAAVHRFVSHQRATGVGPSDIELRRDLHQQLIAVLQALPVDPTSRAVIAAHVLGDPHALDFDMPLARLVTHAIATFADLDLPSDSEGRRAVWESVGVVVDQVSSNVLVLGLRVPAEHGLAGQLNAAADAVEPVIVTLRQLRRWPLPAFDSDDPILIVENPSIIESASARPDRGIEQMVCSSGLPAVAVSTLLRQIGAGGVPLLQHADFDPAGLAITNWLRRNAGTTPWKMSASNYTQAVRSVQRVGRPITGAIPVSPWNPQLQLELDTHRVVISEEQLLAEILAPER